MQLYTLGINHKRAPIAIRERLAFAPETTPDALQALLQNKSANEAVILSTCNRTEIYAHTNDPTNIHRWLKQQSQVSDISSLCYQYHDTQAITHLMRVACGLDSMVLGEPQILGQVKNAYTLAESAGSVGQHFRYLFPTIFSASKTIRHKTQIGKHPISLAYAIVHLCKHIFSELNTTNALLIGAGETNALIARHLHSQGFKKIIIANRDLEKARRLAESVDGQTITIQDIPQHLSEAQLVVSATASPLPLIGKGLIEQTLKLQTRPLLLVDLAVPRDIEPEVSNLDSVFLYNLDDLQDILNQNHHDRRACATQAEALIQLHTEDYLRRLRIHNARSIITGYRDNLLSLNRETLKVAQQELENGRDPRETLEAFSHNLIRKILHKPTIKLREAADQERTDVLMLMQELFEE